MADTGANHESSSWRAGIKEDYPWVPPALSALRGMLVPCFPQEMLEKWAEDKTFFNRLRDSVPPLKQPSWLIDAPGRESSFQDMLMKAMSDIGVIENRTSTGKVDVPDIFRLPNGIKRRGGITQQQRRKARGIP